MRLHKFGHMDAFQSTHPVRGGTTAPGGGDGGQRFQSTHPVRGGTARCPRLYNIIQISIHPPREGWDASRRLRVGCCQNFNPPTP